MLKKAVKLLRGSVCVRAKSAYPERMLNLCSARGIEFWDVRWIDDTALSFCVARGDLRALRRAAEGCGAEVSIERTAGTPFFFARLRRRHALFAGGILCAALLLVNSLFIWDFEVTGNETVPTETILHALREHGVHRGTFIYSFRSQDICKMCIRDRCFGISSNVHQINEEIRDSEIRLISATGEQLGIMSAAQAQHIADEQGLDLVKISPQAKPPVCKLMDYGKFRFEQGKMCIRDSFMTCSLAILKWRDLLPQ